MSAKKTTSPKKFVSGGSLENLISKYQGVNVASDIFQNLRNLHAIEVDTKEIDLFPLFDENLFVVDSSTLSPYPAFICHLEEKEKPVLFSSVENYIIAKRNKTKLRCYLIRDITETEIIAFILSDLAKRGNPLFLAQAYKSLKDVYSFSYSKLSTSIGVSKAQIINRVKLLSLPPPILDQLKAGTLSYTHARAINGLSTAEEKIDVFNSLLQEKISVRDIERLVRQKKNQPTNKLTTYFLNEDKITIFCSNSTEAKSLLEKIKKFID